MAIPCVESNSAIAFDLGEVPSRDGRVYLNRNRQFPSVVEHAEGAVETAGPTPKGIVRGGVRAIEADS